MIRGISKRRGWLISSVLIVILTLSLGWVLFMYNNSAGKYLGTWNYDQPELASKTNIATIDVKQGFTQGIPQIGTITFTKTGTEVIGRTDQGCTWHFKQVADSLQLTSTKQYCFNHVINSGYNIYEWKVSVNGNYEKETLKAVSFLPDGRHNFVLQNGKRTKASLATQDQTMQNFIGIWKYAPANFQTQVNILATIHMQANNAPVLQQTPLTGSISFSKGSNATLVAHTDNGCHWTLEAHGNTAELSPTTQTCNTIEGTYRLSFFSIASNGVIQNSIMSGVDAQNNPFQLTVGSLTR